MRRARSACCATAALGHTDVAPIPARNSRRLIDCLPDVFSTVELIIANVLGPVRSKLGTSESGQTETSARRCAAQQLASLFDHFIGAREQRLWDRDPQRLGGLQIDD